MGSVSVNPPKTPVTKGSNGIATATIPNICKMPGPPAPFVPAPLPNIGKSGSSPKDYSQDVTIEGNAVAIKGSTFESMGDMASKGTGGGLISANTHGITKFVGPGSMDVKIEGKNVQFLSDPMLNNCGPGGSPPNAATMVGVLQAPGLVYVPGDEKCPLCDKEHGDDVKLESSESAMGTAEDVRTALQTAVTDASTPAAIAANAPRFDAAISILEAAVTTATGKPRQKLKDRIRQRNKEKAGPPAISTMVGGVVGKCGSGKYAGTSMTQYSDVVDKYSHHAPKPTHSIGFQPDKQEDEPDRRASFKKAIGAAHQGKFDQIWNQANTNYVASLTGGTTYAHYPPGYCAGQQTLLAAMDHICRPVGLAELWFSSRGATLEKVKLRVRDAGGPKEGRLAVWGTDASGDMGPNKPIPPCETCNVILQALMCPDDKPLECSHAKDPGCVRC